MKSNMRVVSIVLGIFASAALADDKRDKQLAEIEAIKAELKPLRQKAYREADVIAEREKLDAAYKAYWDTVRVAMLRLDPSKAALIEKDVALRKQLEPIASETAQAMRRKAGEKIPKISAIGPYLSHPLQ